MPKCKHFWIYWNRGGATDVSVQSKTVTPTTNQQVVTPDSGYDYLSQVTVEKIPYKEELNSAGGMSNDNVIFAVVVVEGLTVGGEY